MVCPERPSQEGKQVGSRGDSREPWERTGCGFGRLSLDLPFSLLFLVLRGSACSVPGLWSLM